MRIHFALMGFLCLLSTEPLSGQDVSARPLPDSARLALAKELVALLPVLGRVTDDFMKGVMIRPAIRP